MHWLISTQVATHLGALGASALDAEIEATFVARARHAVACKGARPDRVRFAALPRNFKGAVLVKELKAAAWD